MDRLDELAHAIDSTPLDYDTRLDLQHLIACVRAADAMCAHDSFYCRVYVDYERARAALGAKQEGAT